MVQRITVGKQHPTIPLSQAILINGTMYISGQVGRDPATGKVVPGGVEKECEQALKNLDVILQQAGMTRKNIVKCMILMQDLEDFAKVNKVYRDFFGENFPARTAYQVARLPVGANVEIDSIAVEGTIIQSKL